MNKSVLVSIVSISIASISCFAIYSYSNQYVFINAGEGRVYKSNKRTGETVLIVRNKEIPIKTPEPPKPPKQESPLEKAERLKREAEEEAIRLVKTDYTLGGRYLINNDSEIRSRMEEMKGEITIIGWEATKVGDNLYLVTYSYNNGSGILSFPFEANTSERIVRYVVGDSALQKKYGFK